MGVYVHGGVGKWVIVISYEIIELIKLIINCSMILCAVEVIGILIVIEVILNFCN